MDIENKTPDTKKGKKNLRKVIGIGLIIAAGTVGYGFQIANYAKINRALEIAAVKILGKENVGSILSAKERVDEYMANGLYRIFYSLGIPCDM